MPDKVIGKVVSYSERGDLVTDISAGQLTTAPRDERVTVRCDEYETTCLFSADHQQPESTLIAIINAHGKLELQIVGDSARMMLGVPLGESVEVRW